MDDLIPLQADYNDARSREAAIRRTLTPKLIGANGSVDTMRLSSRVEFLGYNPGMGDKPTLMIPDSGWMAQYESSMNRAQSEMSDRAGESMPANGKTWTTFPSIVTMLAEWNKPKAA